MAGCWQRASSASPRCRPSSSTHLSDAQKRAYVLADNRLAERAGWDRELLALELGELAELGTDLGSLGFEALELDALLGNELPDPREEETPEPPVVPASRPGDLWLLGPHRLLCGSSTVATDVARLLGGVTPAADGQRSTLRGQRTIPSWRNQAGAARTRRTGKVLNDDRADWREAWALFPGEVVYVWHGALHAADGRREPRGMRLRDPESDHLGEGTAGALPRRLPLAARALLLRGEVGRQGPLERRPQADDALADPEPRPGRRRRCMARRSRSSACADRC